MLFRRGDEVLLYKLLADASFFELLLKIDMERAEEARRDGCPACRGTLHVANYLRKPRGAAIELGIEQARRFSLCCGAEGCRRRMTPPSVRFLGRRVYLALMVVVAGVLLHGVTSRRVAVLSRELEVSRQTVERWRAWWRDEFSASSTFKAARGWLMPVPDTAALPASLIDCFVGDERERMLACLKLLCPLSTTSCAARARDHAV